MVYWLARWYRSTGMLVDGGIPLLQALRISEDMLPLAQRHRARQVESGIGGGLAPSQAYEAAGMATPIARQFLIAGERTGDLGAVLTRLADFHENEVSRAVEKTMRVFEPVVMLAIGVGVGMVVVLMYLPIFELASAIN
jgi:general secretion pathway protein F